MEEGKEKITAEVAKQTRAAEEDAASTVLGRKYQATTRLLEAQCETIAHLHSLLERAPPLNAHHSGEQRQLRASTNCDERLVVSGGGHGELDEAAGGDDAGGAEMKYRRAKRLVKRQSADMNVLRERLERSEATNRELSERAAAAEKSLKTTHDVSLQLRGDYSSALAEAHAELTRARKERDQEAAATVRRCRLNTTP